MSKPLLTVAIPTYNRPETLQRTLNILKAESAEKFTILVSDDSSTDGVEKLVQTYQQSMSNLRYSKNPANLGFSRNVARLYEIADTRYVWFLCDDDSVNPGAIDSINKALVKYEPVVAIFNCTWGDSFGRNMTAGVTEDRLYTDFESFDRYDVLMRLTFLSIVVVEKTLPIEPISNDPACKDNVFVQVTLGLYLLSDKFRLCEVASTILHRNVGFKYGEFFKFILLDPLKAVYLMPHKFENRKFIRWMVNQLPSALQLFLSQKIGLFSYTGKPTKATLRKVMEFYGLYGVPIILLRVLCYFMPSPLIRAAYLLKLIHIHGGFKKGVSVYQQLVDRAQTDQRKTGFTSYR